MTTATARDLLLDAADRMELTEEGWVEKVVLADAGNMDHRLSAYLVRRGVPDDWVLKNTRLTSRLVGPKVVWYAPDAMVVLPDNPVRWTGSGEYPGVPDLVVEVLGTTRSERDKDKREKKRNYAAMGVPLYWIAEPADGTVQCLELPAGQNGALAGGRTYREVWTGKLADCPLPAGPGWRLP